MDVDGGSQRSCIWFVVVFEVLLEFSSESDGANVPCEEGKGCALLKITQVEVNRESNMVTKSLV